jgi:hypothetical protein
MIAGRVLALVIAASTAALIFAGTAWPNPPALAMAGPAPQLLRSSATPEASVESLLGAISRRDWAGAYAQLANKNEFTEPEFERDLTGGHGGLRSYATLGGFDINPVHATADEAQFRANLQWSSVVGTFQDVRHLKVVKTGDRWRVVWPIVEEPKVPAQVIPVNYLRWDVVYSGSADDWGNQDVESPHVRIIDMHPVNRMDRVVILGELLNEDVVPAYVTVKATLLARDGFALATEDAFDKMCHILLPRQVTPFRIDFENTHLSQVDSVRMDPSASLVRASADPVIEIENQRLNPLPEPSLSGDLVNESGQVVNVAHVLATFYDNSGQIVWVSDDYPDRALLPQTPQPFVAGLPADLAGKVTSFRVVTSSYSSDRFQ